MTYGFPDTMAEQAEALAQRGMVAQAYRLLEQGIAAGHGMAALTLAQWRLSGQFIRRDLAIARDLFGRAGTMGLEDAISIHIAMLASGAGGTPRKWAEALALLQKRTTEDAPSRRQSELLRAMNLTDEGDPVALAYHDRQHDDPRIDTVPLFLTPEECAYLIDTAVPLMQPSVVIHPQTGGFVRDQIRKAKSAAFPFILEDPVLHAINRRIAAATGTDYAQGEPLQVLRYDPGDEYKLHSDALPPGNNQRIATVLIALNENYEGGATEFPRLSYRWRGKTGDALRFDNIDATDSPHGSAWHAGARVVRGTKFLLSKWIRQSPLDLSGPPGRPF